MHLNFPPFPYVIPVVPFFSSLGAVLVDQYCNPLADVTLDSISAQLDEITEKVKKMLRIKNPSHPSRRIAQGQLLSLTELEKNICFLFFSVLFLSFFPFIMFLQRFIISWCLKPEGLGFPFLVHSKKSQYEQICLAKVAQLHKIHNLHFNAKFGWCFISCVYCR